MGAATTWLQSNSLFPRLIEDSPDERIGMIIVVPAYDEPGITVLLGSLNECTPPSRAVEVIVVVNARDDASDDALENNRLSIVNILSWKEIHPNSFLNVHIVDVGQAPMKKWGVGMARKAGMDEALRRFDAIGNLDGVIVCLDADCKVSTNYLVEIESKLLVSNNYSACSIYFEHPLSSSKGEDAEITSPHPILFYELHLRYYVHGLRLCGFPHSYHTVGSAIAVKAYHYMKAGGMSKKQAGEDFYFIQKLVQSGRYGVLNTATVYPSARLSYRVPFGTGNTMTKLSSSTGSDYRTYDFRSFYDLKQLFDNVDILFGAGEQERTDIYLSLPEGVRDFISQEEWNTKIAEIVGNTSTVGAFKKRFFSWFNMFKVVKYMNHVHERRYGRCLVVTAAAALIGESPDANYSPEYAVRLLESYRSLERHADHQW